jgi:hypothetical protein
MKTWKDGTPKCAKCEAVPDIHCICHPGKLPDEIKGIYKRLAATPPNNRYAAALEVWREMEKLAEANPQDHWYFPDYCQQEIKRLTEDGSHSSDR